MIKLLGIPYDANSSYLRGSARAPDLIRHIHKRGASNAATEEMKVMEFGINLFDQGDIEFNSSDRKLGYERIKQQVGNQIRDGSKLISLGGDHSITFPIIEAHHPFYPELHILHFDAHGDLYDNFEDQYFSHASPFARIMENGLAASLTSVGVRTLTGHQRAQAGRFGVQIIEMKDWNFDWINTLPERLYLSFDLDVLDPAFAPGVSHHEPGGLSVRQVISCMHKIKSEIIGADIVEYNPDQDINEMTAMVGYKMLKEIWAKMG